MRQTSTSLTKDYAVFDCDAHVTESPAIWDYLSRREKELVKPWFWAEGDDLIVNGRFPGRGSWAVGRPAPVAASGLPRTGFVRRDRRIPSGIEVAGPGTNKKIIRKLYSMNLSEEQCDYVDQKGARDPHARLRDMDLQGIDQVMVVPLTMISAFLFVENIEAARLLARAYNDWIADWCAVAPDRLFPAAVLPVHHPPYAARELHRVAKRGFRAAMVRPVDAQGLYPTQVRFESLWRAFEETGVVLAMHTLNTRSTTLNRSGRQWSPGEFTARAVNPRQITGPCQALGFVSEAMTWLANVLLTGWLEARPGLSRVAIMESNASWLTTLLEEFDRTVRLHRNESRHRFRQLPSETFRERCAIAFEGDETPVFRQHDYYADLGIWSSDVYHHDGADAWLAIREMREAGVPREVEAQLMGANARRLYGIEPRSCVTEQAALDPRPDWYPRLEDVEREYADRTRVE